MAQRQNLTRTWTATAVWVAWIAVVGAIIAPAGAMIVVDPPTEGDARILPHPGPIPDRRIRGLEMREHRVTAAIADQVATTTVELVYHNPSPSAVEGTFLFPLPRGAHIQSFSMDVNGELVEAELLDADRARKIYEDIVRRQRDPALLEYAGAALIKYRIFPIEGRSDKRVTLRYTQVLAADNNLITYTYPLNTGKYSAQPVKAISARVTLESRQAIKSVYSPTHDVDVTRRGDHKVVAGFETSDAGSDLDFQLIYGVEKRDAAIGVNLMTYTDPDDAGDGYFLLLASPGALQGQEIIRKDVVFVIDTSGSMAGKKMEQAKGAVNYCIASLNEGDRFQVIRFATDVQELFDGLVDATPANRKKATRFVDGFRAAGGTAIEEALVQAVAPAAATDASRPYTVIFMTDGLPTVGTRDENQIVATVLNKIGSANVRIFSFGVGLDVNTHLLDKMTEKTKAFSQYVLPQEDIEVKVSNFFSRISEPVLTDVELQIDGGVRLSKVHPRPLPDLFIGDQLIVLGRYEGHGKATLTLAGTVNGKPTTFVHEAEFAAKAQEHPFIAQLWATRRVGFLLDEIRLHSDTRELREEVAQLARRYGIVTPYTSYLIVEDEAGRGVALERRSLQEASLPAARRQAGDSYARMSMTRSGEAAVAGAGSNQHLKNADQLGAPSAARAYAMVVDRDNQQIVQQNVRMVRGRAFYQNGEQWIDANVAEKPQQQLVRITFDSPEYYALLKRHPDAANWLSVGRNVQILLEETIYEISEEEG